MRQSPEPRLAKASLPISRVLLLAVLCVFVARDAAAQISATLTSNLASPQSAGTSITWTATVTGGTAPYTYKWWLSPDNGATYTALTGWVTSNTFVWTPTTVNSTYRVAYWVRNAGNTAELPDTTAAANFAVTAPPPISGTLTSNLASPQGVGTPITWTATVTGGAAPHTFKWWLSPDSGATYTALTGWVTSNTFVWTPTTANASYRVAYWVRNAGNTAELPDTTALANFVITSGPVPSISSLSPTSGHLGTSVTIAGTNFGATPGSVTFNGVTANATSWNSTSIVATVPSGATTGPVVITVGGQNSNGATFTVTAPPQISGTLSSNLTSPQGAGTAITWTATVTGGAAPHTFKWWLSPDNGATYTALTEWVTSNTFVWTPTTPNASYRVAYWVRNAGNTADLPDTTALANFVITSGPVPSISSLSPTSGHLGTSVTITGTNFGATPGSVTFNGVTANATSWNSTSIVATVPSGATTGPVVITAGGQNSNGATFTVTAAPQISATLSSNLASPQGAGTSITWTATVTGGATPLTYKWWLSPDNGVSYTALTGWVTSNTFVWTPTTPNASYRVAYWVRNSGNTAEVPDTTAAANFSVTPPPPVSATLSSNLASPQPVNTPITFTASPSGGLAPFTYKWWQSSDGGATWTELSTWATSNTFVWTPTVSGAYSVAVWVRNSGNTAEAADTVATMAFTVTAAASTAPTISSLNPAAGTIGASVTIAGTNFGATPGSVRFNGVTATVTNWSPTSIVATVPAGATPGPVVVTVGTQSSNGVAFTVWTPAPYVTLSADRSSPQPVNTSITFTAAGSGGGAPYSYKFWVTGNNGSTWTVVRDWSTTPTYVWHPTQVNGLAGVGVWMRSAFSTADVAESATWLAFPIGATSPYTHVLLSANKTSSQPGGSAVTFTATGSDGIAPYLYKWLLSSDGGASFSAINNWGPATTFTWLPTQPGNYAVGVWIKSESNPSDEREDGRQMPFTITSAPAQLASLTASLPSPQPAGTTVTWTATSTGGNGPHSYKFLLSSDSGLTWAMERDWGTSSTYAWQPALKSWDYRIRVLVRSALNPTETPEHTMTASFEISGTAPTSSVIWDAFTSSGAMDGRIPDIAPPGRSWSRIAGGLSPILNGLAVAVPAGAAAGFTTEVIDSGLSNGQVAVDFRSTSTMPTAALVLRSVDANNLLLLRYIGGPATGRVELVKRVAGQLTVVQWVPVGPVQVGSPHRLEAHLSGTSITARFDGLSVFEVSLTDHQGATRHGVTWEIPAALSTTYDEFQVSNALHVSTLPPGTRCIGDITKQIIRVFPDSDEMAGRTEVINMPQPCQYRIRLFEGGRATLNGPTLRSGNGAVGFFFNYDYNSPFISFAVVAGHFVTISQTSTTGIECSFALSTTVLEYPETGGTDSFTVTPSHPGVCPWAAVFGEPWVTIYNAGIHTGPATVIATVDPNPLQITRDARGYVGIVGDVKLQQIADPCVFSVNQTSFSNLSRFGGPMEVTVTIPNGCGWETWSLTEGIVRVDSPLPADNPAGTGQIHMYLLENTAAGPRIGRVHVGKPYSVYESLEIELIQCGTSSPVCPMGPEEDPDDDLPPPNGNDPGGDSSFFHLDALGSVRMVTDVNQQILGRYDYQPFGQDWETTGSSPATNTLRFTAKERDLETAVGQWQALDYSGARYLQSQTGRFTSVDPIFTWDENLIDPQRWNRYVYVRNNPLRYVDPDGRQLMALPWFQRLIAASPMLQRLQNHAIVQKAETLSFTVGLKIADFFSRAQGQEALKTAAEFATGLDAGPSLLPAVSATTMERALMSAAETGGKQGTVALRALASHIDRGQAVFQGLKKTEQVALDLIRSILKSPTRVVGTRTIDYYDKFGRGVRLDAETGGFMGFLDAAEATR